MYQHKSTMKKGVLLENEKRCPFFLKIKKCVLFSLRRCCFFFCKIWPVLVTPPQPSFLSQKTCVIKWQKFTIMNTWVKICLTLSTLLNKVLSPSDKKLLILYIGCWLIYFWYYILLYILAEREGSCKLKGNL